MDLYKKVKSLLFKKELDQFWIQKIPIKRVEKRIEILKPHIQGKKILHIGCTDYPIFNPKTNLHIQISTLCSELHGMDIDEKGLQLLKSYYPGKYFSDLSKIKNYYDIILVPETIEHVSNIQSFLNELNQLNSNKMIISGPNCFNEFFKHKMKNNTFTEAVHPDHNVWFSPYTLKNVIEKYTDFKVNEVFLTNKDLSVVCYCERS